MDTDRDSARPTDKEVIAKKVYVAPKLTEYGSVARLTESGPASARSDVGHNVMHT
jgi:hypothetical protein